MADFSYYGTLDLGWVEFEKTIPVFPQSQDLTTAKREANERRALLFRDTLEPIGRCCLFGSLCY